MLFFVINIEVININIDFNRLLTDYFLTVRVCVITTAVFIIYIFSMFAIIYNVCVLVHFCSVLG